MHKKDLSSDRQKRLVPLEEYPGAQALIPPPVPDNLDIKGVDHGQLVRAHDALDLLEEVSSRLPNPNLLTRTYDRREAVRSSQIEGTYSGMDDLFAFEATGSDEGSHPDVRVTKNYVVALEEALSVVREHGAAAINCQLIQNIHARLMEGVDFDGVPGQFRERQNWIGSGGSIYNATYVPPPHTEIRPCLEDLESLLQYSAPEEAQMVPSIVSRMAIAHAQFEAIHPFIDGNGRVGRILLPLMLAAENYPPVYLAGYLKENQRDYYDALAGVQLKGKWADWLNFFSTGVEVAVQESIRTGLALEKLLDKWKTAVSELGLRSHSIMHQLPELLLGTPVLTAHQAKEMLNTSFPSASASLAKLEDMGILNLKKQQRRNRIFVAQEVIDILNRSVQKMEVHENVVNLKLFRGTKKEK